MKVFFVTLFEAQNIKNWSGTAFYLSKSLQEAGVEVEYIGNLKSLPGNDLRFRLRDLFYNKLFKNKFGTYIRFYEPRNLQYIAGQVSEKLKNKQGIVLSPGAIPIAYLKTNMPVVLWTDATFAVMKDYYSEFMGLSSRTIKNCNAYEKKVLTRSDLSIFSSDWAAQSAINDYGADPARVKVISYGANIECDRTFDSIIENNNKKSKDTCKLLFVGQDWERKGAEAAVAVAKELNNRNIKTELTIVGCEPPPGTPLPGYIKVKGFIKKSEKAGAELMDSLYAESHFFILPTLAECTPIVFSEANSFGLPVLTTDTGGISSIIVNDINGRMFGPQLNIAACVAYIIQFHTNVENYNEFSLSAFKEYMTRLNWQTSIAKSLSYMKDLSKAEANNTIPNSPRVS